MRARIAGRTNYALCSIILAPLWLVVPPASASLVTFGLEITTVSGSVVTGTAEVTAVHPGSVINMNIYAVLHGAVANDGIVQVVGNLHDETGSFAGSFSASNALVYSSGAGTQPGTQVAAANGSQDIGSESFWQQGASDAVTGNTYFADAAPGAASFLPVTGTPAANGDLKLSLGTASYTVSNPSGFTFLYFFPHLRTDGDVNQMQDQRFVLGGVQYQLDGAGNNSAAGVSNAFDLEPVLVFTPEPGTLVLGALAGLGLLLHRRRKQYRPIG